MGKRILYFTRDILRIMYKFQHSRWNLLIFFVNASDAYNTIDEGGLSTLFICGSKMLLNCH